MIVRDQTRGEHSRSQVAEAASGRSPVLLIADLSVQADIRRVAQEVSDRYDHIDILINNAGNAFNRPGTERGWTRAHVGDQPPRSVPADRAGAAAPR